MSGPYSNTQEGGCQAQAERRGEVTDGRPVRFGLLVRHDGPHENESRSDRQQDRGDQIVRGNCKHGGVYKKTHGCDLLGV